MGSRGLGWDRMRRGTGWGDWRWGEDGARVYSSITAPCLKAPWHARPFSHSLLHATSCPSPDVSPRCLRSHTPESVMELVEAAPFNLSRRFKNYHHELNH